MSSVPDYIHWTDFTASIVTLLLFCITTVLFITERQDTNKILKDIAKYHNARKPFKDVEDENKQVEYDSEFINKLPQRTQTDDTQVKFKL